MSEMGPRIIYEISELNGISEFNDCMAKISGPRKIIEIWEVKIMNFQLEDPSVDVESIDNFRLAFLMQFFAQHKARFGFPRLRLQDLYHRVLCNHDTTAFSDLVVRILRFMSHGDPDLYIDSVDRALDRFTMEKRTALRISIQRKRCGKSVQHLDAGARAALLDSLIESVCDEQLDFNFISGLGSASNGPQVASMEVKCPNVTAEQDDNIVFIKAGQDAQGRSYYYLDDLRIYRERSQSNGISSHWDVVVGPTEAQWRNFIASLTKNEKEEDLHLFLQQELLELVLCGINSDELNQENTELDSRCLRSKELTELNELRRSRGMSPLAVSTTDCGSTTSRSSMSDGPKSASPGFTSGHATSKGAPLTPTASRNLGSAPSSCLSSLTTSSSAPDSMLQLKSEEADYSAVQYSTSSIGPEKNMLSTNSHRIIADNEHRKPTSIVADVVRGTGHNPIYDNRHPMSKVESSATSNANAASVTTSHSLSTPVLLHPGEGRPYPPSYTYSKEERGASNTAHCNVVSAVTNDDKVTCNPQPTASMTTVAINFTDASLMTREQWENRKSKIAQLEKIQSSLAKCKSVALAQPTCAGAVSGQQAFISSYEAVPPSFQAPSSKDAVQTARDCLAYSHAQYHHQLPDSKHSFDQRAGTTGPSQYYQPHATPIYPGHLLPPNQSDPRCTTYNLPTSSLAVQPTTRYNDLSPGYQPFTPAGEAIGGKRPSQEAFAALIEGGVLPVSRPDKPDPAATRPPAPRGGQKSQKRRKTAGPKTPSSTSASQPFVDSAPVPPPLSRIPGGPPKALVRPMMDPYHVVPPHCSTAFLPHQPPLNQAMTDTGQQSGGGHRHYHQPNPAAFNPPPIGDQYYQDPGHHKAKLDKPSITTTSRAYGHQPQSPSSSYTTSVANGSNVQHLTSTNLARLALMAQLPSDDDPSDPACYDFSRQQPPAGCNPGVRPSRPADASKHTAYGGAYYCSQPQASKSMAQSTTIPSQPMTQPPAPMPPIQVNNTFFNAQLNVQQMNYQHVAAPGATGQMPISFSQQQQQQQSHFSKQFHNPSAGEPLAPNGQRPGYCPVPAYNNSEFLHNPIGGDGQTTTSVISQSLNNSNSTVCNSYGNTSVQITPKTPHTIQYLPTVVTQQQDTQSYPPPGHFGVPDKVGLQSGPVQSRSRAHPVPPNVNRLDPRFSTLDNSMMGRHIGGSTGPLQSESAQPWPPMSTTKSIRNEVVARTSGQPQFDVRRNVQQFAPPPPSSSLESDQRLKIGVNSSPGSRGYAPPARPPLETSSGSYVYQCYSSASGTQTSYQQSRGWDNHPVYTGHHYQPVADLHQPARPCDQPRPVGPVANNNSGARGADRAGGNAVYFTAANNSSASSTFALQSVYPPAPIAQ